MMPLRLSNGFKSQEPIRRCINLLECYPYRLEHKLFGVLRQDCLQIEAYLKEACSGIDSSESNRLYNAFISHPDVIDVLDYSCKEPQIKICFSLLRALLK